MKKTLKNRKGFTLVEILLYVATSSLIIASFAGLILLQYTTNSKTKALIEVEEQAQQISNFLIEEVKKADTITSPLPGNTASTLVLSSSNDLPSNITISSVGGDLTVDDTSNVFSLISNLVELDSFEAYNITPVDGTGTLRFTFILKYKTDSTNQSWNYTNTYYVTANIQ